MTAIDELSGIELARAVAEAQGWTVDEDGIYIDVDGQLTQYDAHEHSPDVYRPDCNIAQAWELVEEIKDREFCVEYGGDNLPWSNRWYAFMADVLGVGETASEAICRAYLNSRRGRKALADLEREVR